MNTDLKSISGRLDLLKNIYKYLPVTQKRLLTIPAIFGRSYDENFISDYLAYILDPKLNGVGIEPLQLLLSKIKNNDNKEELEIEDIEIIREYNLGDHGRIDFIIKLGDAGVLGIENKITSLEGENQTVAYAKGIKLEFPDQEHYMVFLSPTGLIPSSKKFAAISYGDIYKLLRDIPFPVLDDIHKVVIWEDFLAHLEGYIIMNEGKLELTEKTSLYIENYKMFSDLRSSYEQDADRIYEFITESIKNSFGEVWTFNFKGKQSWQEITRDSWKLENFRVFFQYLFSRDLLLLDDYPYMLGVYPCNQSSRHFLDWLKKNQPKIKEICSQNSMEAYGPKRGTASYLIAHKSFPLKIDNITMIDQQFIAAADEFLVFQPIMDKALEMYKKQ